MPARLTAVAPTPAVFAAPDNLSFDKAVNMCVVTEHFVGNLNGGNA